MVGHAHDISSEEVVISGDWNLFSSAVGYNGYTTNKRFELFEFFCQ